MTVFLLATVGRCQSVPGALLADDLRGEGPTLVAGYADQRPRLLFTAAEKPVLQAKAKDFPDRWSPVLASARRLGEVPSADDIKNGKGYWRIERIQSAALAHFVTGDEKHLKAAVPWLLAYAAVDTWGTQFRPNKDLEASWYLYHLSLSYDILHGQLTEEQRKTIRDSLSAHAKFIADDFKATMGKDKFRYDQNHTYIPATALTAAALALQGEVPEAADWLKLTHAILTRCRYVLGPDGYYYEGFGYWIYAMHWHVRWAELMGRATGQNYFDLPALRENWRFGLHMSLPGKPNAWDAYDTAHWTGDIRRDMLNSNHGMLWAIARGAKSPESRAVGDFFEKRRPDNDYPAAAFLWFSPEVQPADLSQATPYHHFADHDVMTWRSGWDKDATAIWFRCGPPEGHAAAGKLKELKDWIPNAGHVHPDIGAFLLYAKGTYLATTTGYTMNKWTKDHNTLLIDGKGQAVDGSYHNERGVPYEHLDDAKIEAAHLTPSYGYARGTFGSAYTRQVKDVELKRNVLITKKWLLLVDDMSSAEPHALTWICHADAPFVAEDGVYVSKHVAASLAVITLTADLDAKAQPTTVLAGKKVDHGVPEQRGHELYLTMKTPAKTARIINLLVPIGKDEKPPKVTKPVTTDDVVTVEITWPDGKVETASLKTRWTKDGEPASIK
jgi:hypothetical protein